MYYFIVNTHAKTGNSIHTWDKIKTVLDKEGIPYQVYETLYAGYATEVVKELTEHSVEHINLIIVGGDGTINEVVNGISDFSNISIGVIPAGTGNDFARNLGIKGSTEEVLNDILSRKEETRLDLTMLHWESKKRSRVFAISSGVGFDALVTKRNTASRIKPFCNKLGLGKLSYLIATVQSLFLMRTYAADVTVEDKPVQSFNRVIFSSAMNLRAEGGGIAMAPRATATDGLISFCVAAEIPWYKLPFYLILLVLAKHENLKCFHVYNCSKCHIRTNKPVTIHCDGEYLGEASDLWYESLPQKLSILNTITDK